MNLLFLMIDVKFALFGSCRRSPILSSRRSQAKFYGMSSLISFSTRSLKLETKFFCLHWKLNLDARIVFKQSESLRFLRKSLLASFNETWHSYELKSKSGPVIPEQSSSFEDMMRSSALSKTLIRSFGYWNLLFIVNLPSFLVGK